MLTTPSGSRACSSLSVSARRPHPDAADVVVFNTCTVREKPDTRLAAYLGNAGARKRERPDLVVAVGGCYAEAQREKIFERYPFVDVAFGPGLDPTPRRVDRRRADTPCLAGSSARTSTSRPTCRRHQERRFQAWVQVSMGCNSKCAYCIVPAVRGREQSRRPGEIVAEVTALAGQGITEITLLGQNVNSWGRDLAPDVRTEFGELLRACDAVEGIRRIRFTSPTSEGLSGTGDRRDGRVRLGLRARPPAASVGILADPQAHAAHVRPRALPPPRRHAAGAQFPTSRSAPTSSSASRARRTTDFEATISRSSRRSATRARSRSSSPRARDGGRDHAGSGSRRGEARAPGTPRRHRAPDRCRAKRRADRTRRGGSRRRPEPNGCVALARSHASEHHRQLRRGRPSQAGSSTSWSRARRRRPSAVASSLVVAA